MWKHDYHAKVVANDRPTKAIACVDIATNSPNPLLKFLLNYTYKQHYILYDIAAYFEIQKLWSKHKIGSCAKTAIIIELKVSNRHFELHRSKSTQLVFKSKFCQFSTKYRASGWSSW